MELFGADRQATDARAILVATQTVEVGLDLDATALVTEAASWDALVQRLGRLNRRGELDASQATIVYDDVTTGPVYGTARDRAWEFVRARVGEGAGLDVSPLACRDLNSAVPESAYVARTPPPLLLAVHLDAWTRTQPAPTNDAPVGPYLHGLARTTASVSLAWRASLLDLTGDRIAEDAATQVIDAVPLRAAETIELPISAVRRWLVGEKAVPLSDWDDWDDLDESVSVATDRRVLRRTTAEDGSASWVWADASDLRPGDQLIAPCELGGLDRYGWNPSATEPVADVGEYAAFEQRLPVLRLDAGLGGRLGIEGMFSQDDLSELREARDSDDADRPTAVSTKVRDRIVAWLRAASSAETPWTAEDLSSLAAVLADGQVEVARDRRRWRRHEAEAKVYPAEFVLRPRTRPQTAAGAFTDDVTDGTVRGGSRVTLRSHLADVGGRAGAIAAALGLSTDLQQVVVDAARWHDLGKVDPRFQALLFDGNALAAEAAPEPLAKSGMPPAASERRQAALSPDPPMRCGL
ncbi:hypothetical protein GCM10027062_09200 [Nocardioides hungaricus]